LGQRQEGGSEAAIWEHISTIKDQFPVFNLGDKVVLAVKNNVRQGSNEKEWKVYYRNLKI